jgi:hypothetical protein
VEILITRNGFWTLMDVVIADRICIDMVQQASTMTTHAMMMVIQEKNIILH